MRVYAPRACGERWGSQEGVRLKQGAPNLVFPPEPGFTTGVADPRCDASVVETIRVPCLVTRRDARTLDLLRTKAFENQLSQATP